MISPQKPYFVSRRIEVLYLESMPSKIMAQIYPRTIPPIRFGIKNTVLKRLLPFIFCVRMAATVKARTLMRTRLTSAKTAVY